MRAEARTQEISRLEVALSSAIGEAKIVFEDVGVCPQFHEIVRHARELHDILLETMVELEPHIAERLRGLTDSFGNAIGELELLDFMGDGRLQ
jgi:hypothetical protein